MQIPREIRKKLESSLPSYVLDFLTEKFIELEKYCEEAKLLKQENEFLKNQVYQQDQIIREALSGQGGQKQQKGQPMGYQQMQTPEWPETPYGPNFHHNPWEDWDYPNWDEYWPEAQRGGRGRGRGGRGTRNEITMQRGRGSGRGSSQGASSGGRGGSSGGQSGGQGGAGGSQAAAYVPDVERLRRRTSPIYSTDRILPLREYDEGEESQEDID